MQSSYKKINYKMRNKYYTNIKNCRICKSNKLQSVLNLGKQPAANNLHNNKSKIKDAPLHMKICRVCKTVQLSSTINPKFLFSNYYWVTGTSKIANNYAQTFYEFCKKRLKKRTFKVFEVACNDGTFLRSFKEKKCDVVGIDPAKNIVKNIKDLKIINNFFNFKVSRNIKKKYKNFDLVFARNVIPHVPNILSVIKGISNLIEEKSGIGAIEFHYGNIIQKELHYDSIYHEHYFYFTIKTLSHLLEKFNLNVFDVEKSPISGGSLVIFFSKFKRKKTKKLLMYEKLEKKEKVNSIDKWLSFGKKSKKHASTLYNLLKKLKKKDDSKIVAYGASARSSTLLNFSKINNKIIDHVLDKNKLKSNLYTPGTNILIKRYISKKTKIKKYKIILILAWNFKNEIIRDLKKNGFKGNFLLPLPKITSLKN